MQVRAVFTKDRLVRGFLCSVPPAMGGAVLVGFMAKGVDGFNWDAASVAGTGIATAVLAMFTAALALSTADDVAATRELASIEQARFAKEDEPFVIGGAVTFTSALVELDIANVGRGPARDVLWEAFFLSDSKTVEVRPPGGRIERGAMGVLMGGEKTSISFEPWPVGDQGGRFSIRGTYYDRDRRSRHTYGSEPLGGWEAWFHEREADPWWSQTNLTSVPAG